VVDHFLDDLDDFDAFFCALLALNLERAALGLVQDVGTEQRRQVVRVHLVAWQLQYDVTRSHLLYNKPFITTTTDADQKRLLA